MALTAGTRLGPYEILAPIGAGGMGEVYKARDTRLDRTVAVKVLPGHAADKPEARQRFEREARAVSSLSHPHICTLHDVGEQDGAYFLVMEYLEGETLSARLAQGPLPLEQALRCAIQITDALALAHRQGVLHRDLKPGNIMLTKAGAKLLDFGLAKLREPEKPAGGMTALPTVSVDLTQKGTILGTFQYMAPEQLEGKDTDARSDLFSFGAVLYEMLTGRKAFAGASHASLITAIMSSEPAPVSALPPVAGRAEAPGLDHVVRKCLAKSPDDRWQSAQDLMTELKWIAETSSQAAATVTTAPAPASIAAPPPQPRPWLRWSAAGLLAVLFAAALVLSTIHLRETPEPPEPMRFQIPPPEKAVWRWADFPAVSPDGRRIVFSSLRSDGKGVLFLRSLDSLAVREIPGTEGAYSPFWSPDSRSVGFTADGKLKKVDPSGGPVQTLCDTAPGPRGAWNRQGVILFRPNGTSLFQVSASGGDPKPVTVLDASRGETTHMFPYFLPDGRHFLYLAGSSQPGQTGIYVGSLDSKERKRLLGAESNVAYVDAPFGAPSGPGFLIFARGDTLMAQPFDAKKLELKGDAFPIAEQVATFGFAPGASFSASDTGILAYRSGSASAPSQLAWFDRSGKRLAMVGEPAAYSNPALSPDDKRLAIGRADPQARTRDIWVFDLTRGTSSRFTFDPADDLNPIWSPDGARIAFTSERKGPRNIYWKRSDGTGPAEALLESSDQKSVEDWSPDGNLLLFNVRAKTVDVWTLPLAGGEARKPAPLLQGPFSEQQSQISPNGRWIAYASTESGRPEVYVQSFPPGRGKWQVSTAGGNVPRWRRDGKELFFEIQNRLMAVDVKTDGPSFEAGIPKLLFEAPFGPLNRNNYVATRDGQRFLIVTAAEQTVSSPITVVINWLAAAKH
ncbi:MAG TPA: protein kinase [Bryobacterales bacterium]|nr:protein kinase [Bryobacterales bacterium]